MKNRSAKFTVIIAIFVAIMLSFSGCKACACYEWQQVYDVYSQEEGKFIYQSFNVKITQETFSKIKTGFKILIDSDDYLEKYQNYPNAQASINVYQSQWFYFVDESIVILEEAGFFNDITEDTEITFTVNNYIGWDGWGYPIFAVAINDITYLDFKTGHENVLNYVKEKIKNT